MNPMFKFPAFLVADADKRSIASFNELLTWQLLTKWTGSRTLENRLFKVKGVATELQETHSLQSELAIVTSLWNVWGARSDQCSSLWYSNATYSVVSRIVHSMNPTSIA